MNLKQIARELDLADFIGPAYTTGNRMVIRVPFSSEV